MRIKKRYEQQAVQSLENNDKEMTQQDNHLSSPDQVFLEKAQACVMKHLNDSDFDRESFAREMLVSSSTLYNKLRSMTGMTVIEYINNIRLDEAHRIHEAHPTSPSRSWPPARVSTHQNTSRGCIRRGLGNPTQATYSPTPVR